MLHTQVNLPIFTIQAKVRILHPSITKKRQLLDYSWLKHKKRWKNNQRLMKKFLNNIRQYLPHWVWCEWNNRSIYTKAKNEIMAVEDAQIFSSILKKDWRLYV